MSEMRNAIQLFKEHARDAEGFRSKVYRCPAGKLTIGYGRNVEQRGITEAEAEYLLSNDAAVAFGEASRFSFFAELTPVRKFVVMDMIFNLGLPKFREFKKTLQHLKNKEYGLAAVEMLDSAWARQVGRRADILSRAMRDNVL